MRDHYTDILVKIMLVLRTRKENESEHDLAERIIRNLHEYLRMP